MAARLAELALGPPAGLVPDMAGPKLYARPSCSAGTCGRRGKHRPIVPVWLPGKAARAFRAGANLSRERAVGRRTWEEFLAERIGNPDQPPDATSPVSSPRGQVRWTGAVVIAAGVVLVISFERAFKCAGTDANPYRPSTALATNGPYRFTRNPAYLGMAITYMGITLAAEAPWALVSPALLFLLASGSRGRSARGTLSRADSAGAPPQAGAHGFDTRMRHRIREHLRHGISRPSARPQ